MSEKNIPQYIVRRIFKFCPLAGYHYSLLWDLKNDKNKIKLSPDKIRNELFASLANFRKNIRMLAKNELLKFTEQEDVLLIELLVIDEY